MSNQDFAQPGSQAHKIPASGTDGGTIDLEDGSYIWDIIVVQGATPLAATVTLTFRAVGLSNLAILTLPAGTANQNAAYPPLRKGANPLNGSGINNTQIPFFLPTGGVKIDIGGSGIAANTCEITLLASPFPPPWSV